MNPKITSEHLGRGAVVYVRQSTPTQVAENTESQRRQYALVETARSAGFVSVETIDDDLGRSGSGLMDRPGFQKLVAAYDAKSKTGEGGGIEGEGEDIEVLELDFDEALAMMVDGRICDAKTIILLQHATLNRLIGG